MVSLSPIIAHCYLCDERLCVHVTIVTRDVHDTPIVTRDKRDKHMATCDNCMLVYSWALTFCTMSWIRGIDQFNKRLDIHVYVI